MEVVIHSTLSSVQGQMTVATEPSQTVDSLIAAFCTDKGIPHRKEFVLRTQTNNELAVTNKLSMCGVRNGDTLFLGVKVASPKWFCCCSQWWLLAVVAFLIGAIGIAAIIYLKVGTSNPVHDYGVVIDAGSSHSQLYVYTWDGSKTNGTAVVHQTHTCRAQGKGLSSYVSNTTAAGDSLKSCLQEAASQIPGDKLSDSRAYLGATAGMRLLRERDNETAQAIMTSVRHTVDSTPFFYKDSQQVRIIEGKQEGAFGWISINYNTFTQFYGSLFSMWAQNQEVLYGALDLGGASTQITFMPSNSSGIEPANRESLKLYGQTYEVYTHSYNCYGLDEIRRRYWALLVTESNYSQLVHDPCAPINSNYSVSESSVFYAPCASPPTHVSKTNYTFSGGSDTLVCNETVHKLFNTSCKQPDCTFDGIHQPPLHGEFIAFSGFYYAVDFLNLTGDFTYPQFISATKKYCNMTWEEVINIPVITKIKLNACFNAIYVNALLTSYGFNAKNWHTLHFRNSTANGTQLGWTVGYMLNASNNIPVDSPYPSISTLLFILLLLLFIVFLCLSMGFTCHARRVARGHREDSGYQRMSTYGSV